jgi:hypothetical protein
MPTIRTFVKKGNRCDVAVFEVVREKKIRKRIGRTPQFVYCIGDLVFEEGTINEHRGCSAFVWNLDSNTTDPLTAFGYNTVKKSCGDGGVEDVLKDHLLTTPDGKKLTVRSRFEAASSKDGVAREVVFSEKESYKPLLGYGKVEADLNQADLGK